MIGISVAANKEWKAVKEFYKDDIKELTEYVYGEYFETTINGRAVLIYKCGNRKCKASASTQYIIDRFSPEKIILIGTAAGVNEDYDLVDILTPDTAIQGDCGFIEKGERFQDRFITHLDLSRYNVKGASTIASTDKPLIYKEHCLLFSQFSPDRHIAHQSIPCRYPPS